MPAKAKTQVQTHSPCYDICQEAAKLIDGPRQATHGNKLENHRNIASLWNAYLGHRLAPQLSPKDVALMMALLKIARTKLGQHNPDNFVDLVGYGAIAGELADKEQME